MVNCIEKRQKRAKNMRKTYIDKNEGLVKIAVAAAAISLTKQGKKRTFERLYLFPEQAAIVDCDLVDAAIRFTITEATTKVGKTMTHLELLLERACKAGEGNWWWVAPSANQARIAFDRAKDRLLGFIQKPDLENEDGVFARVKVSDNIPHTSRQAPEMQIFVMGATITFKTAENADMLYGEDVRGIVGDEITRWKEASYVACYSTLSATNGWMKLIGNVKGRKNFAYKLARKAQNGEPGWAYFKLTALDAVRFGTMKKEVLEQARRDLTEEMFKELYMAEAASDTGNPFGDISQYVSTPSSGKSAAYGVDLAKSVDWVVVTGLDKYGKVSLLERWQASWQITSEKLKDMISDASSFVDSTGVGDPIVEDLVAELGEELVHGFKFTGPKKQQLMEGLRLALAQGRVTIPSPESSKNAAVLYSELESFEYEYRPSGGVRYSAPEGMHDDTVMSLALATACLGERAAMVDEDSVYMPNDSSSILPKGGR